MGRHEHHRRREPRKARTPRLQNNSERKGEKRRERKPERRTEGESSHHEKLSQSDERTLLEKLGCFAFRAVITIGIVSLVNGIIIWPILRGLFPDSRGFLIGADLVGYLIALISGYLGWKGHTKLSPTFQKLFGKIALVLLALILLGLFSNGELLRSIAENLPSFLSP